jgi:hypothetical protein
MSRLPDVSMFPLHKLKPLQHEHITVSFSGGRTSALMTAVVLTEYRDRRGHDVRVAFANTGQEHEKTLEFVDKCDREWGLGVTWLEAVIDPRKGAPRTYRTTTFAEAARTGAPYEAATAKYGLPGAKWLWCTSILKTVPLDQHATATFGCKPGHYHTAVGIRADEIDRVSIAALDKGFIYPLADLGVTKADVLSWCAAQPWDLEVPELQGNCTWCWKKSDRKLFTLALDNPEAFDFPRMLEERYQRVGPDINDTDRPRRFLWRGQRTTDELFAQAHRWRYPPPPPPAAAAGKHTSLATGAHGSYSAASWGGVGRRPTWRALPTDATPADLDAAAACGESCEVGADFEWEE